MTGTTIIKTFKLIYNLPLSPFVTFGNTSRVRHRAEWPPQQTRVPTYFQKHFPYFFNTKLNIFITIIFWQLYSCHTMQKSIFKTVISGKEQNLNKQILKLKIFIVFQYPMYILVKFKSFPRSWKPVSQFTTFSILAIPRGNPENWQLPDLLLVVLSSRHKKT